MSEIIGRRTKVVTIPMTDGGEQNFEMREMTGSEEEAFFKELEALSATDAVNGAVNQENILNLLDTQRIRAVNLVKTILPGADDDFIHQNLTRSQTLRLIEIQIELNGFLEKLNDFFVSMETAQNNEPVAVEADPHEVRG